MADAAARVEVPELTMQRCVRDGESKRQQRQTLITSSAAHPGNDRLHRTQHALDRELAGGAARYPAGGAGGVDRFLHARTCQTLFQHRGAHEVCIQTEQLYGLAIGHVQVFTGQLYGEAATEQVGDRGGPELEPLVERDVACVLWGGERRLEQGA